MGTGAVAITGATGLVGTALAASCARRRDQGRGAGPRHRAGADRLPSAKLHAWDATGAPPPEAAFEGVDVVVNLVGESDLQRTLDRGAQEAAARQPGGRDARARRRPAGAAETTERPHLGVGRGVLRRSRRRDPHRDLVAGQGVHRRAGPRLGGRGDEGGRDRHARGAAAQRPRAGARRGHPRKILPPFRLGLGGRIGSGAQWMPWIHLDDEIGLIRHAMSHEAVRGRSIWWRPSR